MLFFSFQGCTKYQKIYSVQISQAEDHSVMKNAGPSMLYKMFMEVEPFRTLLQTIQLINEKHLQFFGRLKVICFCALYNMLCMVLFITYCKTDHSIQISKQEKIIFSRYIINLVLCNRFDISDFRSMPLDLMSFFFFFYHSPSFHSAAAPPTFEMYCFLSSCLINKKFLLCLYI